MYDDSNVFNHEVFENMSCNKHDEEMVYHFMIQDAVDFIQLYGVDRVMDDIYSCYHLRMKRQDTQEEMPWVA